MLSKHKLASITLATILGASVFAAVATAQDKGGAKAKPTAPAATPKTITVNELAAKPSAHLGKVTVHGVVGVVNPKDKTFVLIDAREYKSCGISCLSEAGTKKVPVRWSGTLPKVEAAVRVVGTLAKSEKGYTFTATEVGKS